MSNVACRTCVDELVVQGFYNLCRLFFGKLFARALFVRPRTLGFSTWWKISSNLDSALTLPAYLSQSMVHRTPCGARRKSQKSHSRCTRTWWAVNRNSAIRQKSSSVSSSPDSSLAYLRIFTIHFQLLQVYERFAMDFFRGSGNYKTFCGKKLHFIENLTIHGWITRRCQSQSYGNAQTSWKYSQNDFLKLRNFELPISRCFVLLFGTFQLSAYCDR